MNSILADKFIYDICHDIYCQGKDIIISKLIYTVNITDICRKLPAQYLKSIFKNIPVKYYSDLQSDSYCADYDENISDDNISSILYYRDILKYKGSYILVTVQVNAERVTLSTYNNEHCRKNITQFIKKILHDSRKIKVNGLYGVIRGRYPRYYTGMSKRSFNDVFIETQTKHDMISSISNFIKNKDFYKKHKLPYHFGIMLYGEPGTGKSSLISAIANEFNLMPYFVETNDIRELIENKQHFRKKFIEDEDVKLIVIEDIDTCPYATRSCTYSEYDKEDFRKQPGHEYEIRKMNQTTSEFLNLLDGNNCLENVIYIFTTNYIDKIDSAIIRPGRVDKTFNIGYVTNETFSEFTKYHFGKVMPNDREVKKDTLFAEIQTEVMVGKTFEDILEKYTLLKIIKRR